MTKLNIALAAIVALTSMPVVSASAARWEQNDYCTANCENTAPETTETCDSQLGHLSRVFPAEVAGIDNRSRVWVTEICPTMSLMRSDGNAAYLRPTIAQNDVLVEQLGRRDYRPDDVFAVKMMGDDTINLFVHRFDR